MANQILKKFIGADQVDADKILLDNDTAIRSKDSTGLTEKELIKLDADDKVIVTDLKDPASDYDAATKKYVDDAVTGVSGDFVEDAGDTMFGSLVIDGSTAPVPAAANLEIRDHVTNTKKITVDHDSISSTEALSVSGDQGLNLGLLAQETTINGSEINLEGTVDVNGDMIIATNKIAFDASDAYELRFDNTSPDAGAYLKGLNVILDSTGGGNIQLRTSSSSEPITLQAESIYNVNTITGNTLTGNSEGSIQFATNSVTINANLASGTIDMNSKVDMNSNALDGLVAPIQNGQPLIYDQLGAANGVATLDANLKVPASQLPNSVMEYQGMWDASSNTPTLANGAGNADIDIGNVYRVNAAGTVDFGAGDIDFLIGDYVILNSSKIWERSHTADVDPTISSLINEDLTFLKLDGSRAMTGTLDMGSQDIDLAKDVYAQKVYSPYFKTEDQAINVNSDTVYLKSGDTSGTGMSGNVIVESGFSGNVFSGNVGIGSSPSNESGDVSMYTGLSGDESGAITLQTGIAQSSSGTTGDIKLYTGIPDDGVNGVRGIIDISAKHVSVNSRLKNVTDPVDPQDAVTKQYLFDNYTLTGKLYKKTLDATDITNQYIEFSGLPLDTSLLQVFVDRLALHQEMPFGSGTEDYAVTIPTSGTVRITFLNDMVSPGSQQLAVNDTIYVRWSEYL